MNINTILRNSTATLVNSKLGRLLLFSLAMLGATIVLVLLSGLFSSLCLMLPNPVDTIISIIGYIVFLIVQTGLALGYTCALVQLADGQTPSIGILFSRVSLGLRGLGLMLVIGLKLLLWTLPGIGVSIAGRYLADLLNVDGLAAFLSAIGFILSLVLLIPAAFRYAMSIYYLADDPTNGIFTSIDKSKRTMEGHKFQFFRLIIPYILILVGIMLGVTIVSFLLLKLGETGVLLSGILALGAVLSAIYISFLVSIAQACFYTTYRL